MTRVHGILFSRMLLLVVILAPLTAHGVELREFCYFCSETDYCMRLYRNVHGPQQGESQCARIEHNTGGRVFYSCHLQGVTCRSSADREPPGGGQGHGQQEQGCGTLTGPDPVQNGDPVSWQPQERFSETKNDDP